MANKFFGGAEYNNFQKLCAKVNVLHNTISKNNLGQRTSLVTNTTHRYNNRSKKLLFVHIPLLGALIYMGNFFLRKEIN